MQRWDIKSYGRPWTPEEFSVRRELLPEKFEVDSGMLFWSDDDRVNLLGMLLENVGADRAVRLGDHEVWREAVRRLNAPSFEQRLTRLGSLMLFTQTFIFGMALGWFDKRLPLIVLVGRPLGIAVGTVLFYNAVRWLMRDTDT